MKKVFLLGNPRSGTSLLRIMLNCHPDIAAPPECGFLQWWNNEYRNWSKSSLSNGRLDLFLEDLFSSKKIETWELDRKGLRNFLVQKQPEDYSSLTEYIYEFWGSKDNNSPRVIVDKNNYYIHHLDEIKRVWPDANFIHLIRDGRDVACSYKDIGKLDTTSPYKPELPTQIEEIAASWLKNNSKIISFLEKLEKKRFIRVKFEYLLYHTERELIRLCNYLKVTFSKEMLLYSKKNKKFNLEPDETLDWKKKTLERPDLSKAGRYKEDLSKNEVGRFEAVAKVLLRELNYN